MTIFRQPTHAIADAGGGLRAFQPTLPYPLGDEEPRPQTGRPRKIVALIPAGEVYDRTNVRWFAHNDPARDLKDFYNAGDMFVYEASLRLLDFDELEVIPLQSNLDQRTIDRLNDEAAYCFVRGSNYIHNEMEWGNLPEVVDRLRMPVVAFGIGAQAPKFGKVEMSDRTRRFLQVISDRSNKIGVRGAFTAEVLADIGIRNVETIGCPSLMRHNRPSLDIRIKPWEEVRKVGFTLTRGLWPMYCDNIPKSRRMQREMMLTLGRTHDLTIMSQGEMPEKIYFYGEESLIPSAFDALVKDGWFEGPDDPLVQLYRERMFFGRSPAEYERLVQGLDLVLGFRLHGNIMALANGIPAVYVVYDTRTRELVDLLKIPAYDVSAEEEFDIGRFYTQAAFDTFNERYRLMYRKMAAFLDDNGVAHRMRYDDPAPQGGR
jgi:hypothetical protein